MSTKTEHARAAVRHADAGLQAVRSLVRRDRAPCVARPCADASLRDLITRQERLVELHREIAGAAPADVDAIWDQFFEAYDDFLGCLDTVKHDSAARELAGTVRHGADRAFRRH